MKKKIGIFGGTFNPPHKGHTHLVNRASEILSLDKVIIVPSCIPPHKIAGKLAEGEERIEMCRLAFGDNEKFEISSIELDRGDKSYTVETLRELKKLYPDDELYFIVGSDMLQSFRRWYLWEEILSLAYLCAASREEGYNADLSEYTPSQRDRIIFLDIDPMEASSTQIRNSIAGDGEDNDLINKKVLDYIKEKGLYDDGLSEYRKIITAKLDEYRLYHSECVSECAAALAEKYGADIHKAALAGLLHDVMKNAGKEETFEQLEKAGITLSEIEKDNHKVWHQISGAAFLKNEEIITDEEILGAVRWHTTGRADMTLLEKIVYIADFISADRNYPDVGEVRKLAQQSLDDAILYTGKYTIKKLVSTGLLLHPSTVEMYNDILLKGKCI